MSVNGQSNQAKQDKYSSNIKIAYGQSRAEDKARLLAYAQKNQGTGHDRFVFYTSGTMEGKERTSTLTGTGYGEKTGADVTDFHKSVVVMSTWNEVPFFRDDKEDTDTQLDLESPFIKAQASALHKESIKKILNRFKEVATAGTASIMRKDGTVEAMPIPATNIFGDVAKGLKEQEAELFAMLSEMETMATGMNAESEIALVYGTKANGVLKAFDRTSNNDYITTVDFEAKNGKKFAVKKFDVAEMIPIREFDSVIGENYIVGILSNCFGYDSKQEIKNVRKAMEEKGAIFYNSEACDGATIVDENGVFIFKFNGKLTTTTP